MTIDLEHVPLRASLGLMLRQVGLGFRVREDGILMITNRDEVDTAIDEAELAWNYQLQRYDAYYDRQNVRMELRRLKAEFIKQSRGSSRPTASERRGGSAEPAVKPDSTAPEAKPHGSASDGDDPHSDLERDHRPR